MKGELIERKSVMYWLREQQSRGTQITINEVIKFILLLPTEGNVNRQKDLHHYISIAGKHELIGLKEMIEEQLEKCK